MNIKEIGEIRRHIRRDRSNMTHIYGCYVNENKEIISQFRQSTCLSFDHSAALCRFPYGQRLVYRPSFRIRVALSAW